MTAPHERWLDEAQGKVPHGRGKPNVDKREREHYVARASWENGAPIGTAFSEADIEQMRRWQIETDIINSQREENRCSMN